MDINNLSKRAQELWNEWEIRSLILLSLFLQILLIVIGNRRKYHTGIVLGGLVWIAYLSADWVTTYALSSVSRSQGGSGTNRINPTPNNIPAFWAPILLVHLGGPDTITAYALEDNELWLRHLLQLTIQASTASYSLLKSWGGDPLIYIAIPIFVAGISKYGDRVLVLWLASSKKFRDIQSEEVDTFQSEFGKKFPSVGFFDMREEDLNKGLEFNNIIPEAVYLHEAHFFFQMFKIFYADLALSHSSHMASYRILSSKKKATEAFKVIEVELGFMYDVLFTKVTSVCSKRTILRSISFLSSTSALVAFSLMVANKCAYTGTEVIISYILLGGGVVLEIYGFIMLLLSEWAMFRLSSLNKPWAKAVYKAVYSDNNKRWKRYMAQHDLTDAQITKNGALCKMVINSLVCKPTPKACFMKLLGNIQSWEVISDELKELIWKYLIDKRSRYGHEMPQPDPGMNDLKEILAERGDQVLKSMGCLEEFRWAVVEIDFHGSLLLWHIATDICYHDDIRNNKVDANNQLCKRSRSLSNYMLYLLIERPNMLPKGIGQARYKQTGIQLTEFSWCWRSEIITPTHWGSEEFMNEIKQKKGDVSMLNDACKLAKELQSLENNWTNEKKWKMISKIWVEMLTYAASNCGWKEHAQALTRGGELLTRVCLLMAHLGLREQCLTTASTSSREAQHP
ncbi:uncharacterized protein [Populus alba]|uniref:DUF4220 domain-containing protein n=1 Tax=Populus alba x Populus x berolinensis TaxID=444605 RepID=A0AAD6M855_9ROSI|nr:uncharacterized protein LOC118039670 [Populus alba]KAJ6980713.1 hypothetical protein NC653_024152 [Populus alba x Populus x berolinensis]